MRTYHPPTRAAIELPEVPETWPLVSPVDWSAGDRAIAQYFWTSTDKDHEAWTCDEDLIRRVIRFGMKADPVPHGTPFGHGHLTIHVERVPMVIVMQLLRHRVQTPSGVLEWAPNVSQKSGRYTTFIHTKERPLFLELQTEDMRSPAPGSRPGHYSSVPMPTENRHYAAKLIEDLHQIAAHTYNKLIEYCDMVPEQARFILPQDTLTRLYLTASYRNWFNWMVQRDDKHAQEETRRIAIQVDAIMSQLCPITYELWQQYNRRVI